MQKLEKDIYSTSVDIEHLVGLIAEGRAKKGDSDELRKLLDTMNNRVEQVIEKLKADGF